MTKLISRNTVIPNKKSKVFTTTVDGQSTVTIPVLEGERTMAKDNHKHGAVQLTHLPHAPRGVPLIEVTLEIDVNGIFHVTAEDQGTGIRNNITITNDQNRLSPEDIERMINDAEKFADEGKKQKELVEARNELESYAYNLEKRIGGNDKWGGKLDDVDKMVIEEAIHALHCWLDSNKEASVDELKEKMKDLEGKAQPSVSKGYKDAGGAPEGEGEGASHDKDEL